MTTYEFVAAAGEGTTITSAGDITGELRMSWKDWARTKQPVVTKVSWVDKAEHDVVVMRINQALREASWTR